MLGSLTIDKKKATQISFYRRILRIPWTERVSNEENGNKMNAYSESDSCNLVNSMRKAGLENFLPQVY